MKRTTPITKVLTTNCIVVEAKTDLRTVQELFTCFPNRFLPVVKGIQFVGVIFRDEFFQRCFYGTSGKPTAKDFVSKEMIKLSPRNTIEEAKEVFDSAVFDVLPVTDGEGDLMGVLLREDVEAAIHTTNHWNWAGIRLMQRVMSMLAF